MEQITVSGAKTRSIASRGKLLVALPLAFQVLVLVAFAAVVRSYGRATEIHVTEQAVIASSYRLLSLLVDAETGMRGYMLTNDRTFIEPYDRALRELPGELERLRRLAADDRVAALRRPASRVLAYHRASLEAVDSGKGQDAEAAVRKRVGKTLMDAFRAELDRFVTHYAARRDAQERAAARTMRLLLGGIATVFCVTVVLAIAVSTYFTRSIASRIEVVKENIDRFEHGRDLHQPQSGEDEIADLDRGFHGMAAALTAGRTQLERANAELEAFSYSVSHDLRAPVRALNGYARILEEDYSAALDDEGRRFLNVIRSEAERLGTLIDDLLSFARLGKSPVRASYVDMNQLAAEVAAEVVPPTAELTLAPLPPAHGDMSMLRHVLVNLLTNAVKFSASKPRTRIEISASPGEQEHEYFVRDHGVGYDARYTAKLFGVFQRLHAESEFEGTGVGLAIVKRVVERHGGRVWSESRLGEGATFHFTLPAPKKEEQSEP